MNNELYHHGVLGQKWGVRRYQNKDGTLTTAGRKRQAKLENEYFKLTGKSYSKKKSGVKTQKKPVRKKASDMSDEELRNKINRKKLEHEYNRLYPERTSTGKKIVSKAINDVVVPASISVGKRYLEKQFSKALNMPAPQNNNKKKKED